MVCRQMRQGCIISLGCAHHPADRPHHEGPGEDPEGLEELQRTGVSRLAAAAPMGNSYCSCKLTRVRLGEDSDGL